MRPYLRVANVFEDRIDLRDVKQMNFDPTEFEQYRLHEGDVLLNEGQTPELLGRPAIYRGLPQDVCFTNSLIRFQANRDVDPRWALIVFRHHMHSGRFARESRITTNIAHLSIGRLRGVEFPVPPIEEQRRIVDILEDQLSRLDAAAAGLITARRRLIAYQRAALNRLTEDVATCHIALGDALAAVEAGRSFGGAARPSFDDEWGIVKVSAMTWGEFRPAENKLVSDPSQVNLRYQIHAGDLLMSRANTSEYVGAPVLVRNEPARLLLSDKSLRLVPRDGVSPEYLWRVLSAPRARAQISDLASGNQDSMRNISQTTLKTIVIPWTDRQHDVIGAANELDDQRVRMSIVIDRTETRAAALRRGLLRAAFSGLLTGRASDLDRAEESLA